MTEECVRDGVRYRNLAHRNMNDYWVGENGTYWRLHKGIWRELRPIKEPRGGYMVVGVKTDRGWGLAKLHRLVLEVFVGPCPEGMMCRHLDGTRDNNHLDNLCWDTAKRNQADRIIHNTSCRGSGNGGSKITEEMVREIRARYSMGDMSGPKLCKEYGLSRAQISKILAGLAWSHTSEGSVVIPNQGERVYCAKLTEQDVRDIRAIQGKVNQTALARKYGVSQGAIRHILIRKTWKHVK